MPEIVVILDDRSDIQSIVNIGSVDGFVFARNQGISDLMRKIYPKIEVGAIHEAAVLFWGSPGIKNRQDIAPTSIFGQRKN
jgi:hypothetical protein